jgi:tRNA modification GTPase
VLNARLPEEVPLALVANKSDLSGFAPGVRRQENRDLIVISARTGAGMEGLREYLKQRMGYQGPSEGMFTARRRHLDAIDRAAVAIASACQTLSGPRAGELVAEDLRIAQNALSEITGTFTADDLLGEIFASFCIGK